MTEMQIRTSVAKLLAGALLLAAISLIAAANEIPPAAPATQEAPAAAPAPVPAADPRIAAQLEALGYQYAMTADNDYRLIIQIAGEESQEKRAQAVVANSNTESYNKAQIREVWSIALKVASPIDPALADRLLKANNTVKMGAWREWPGEKADDKQVIYIVFAAHIDAHAPQELLEATLNLVSQTADALEKEFTHKDER